MSSRVRSHCLVTYFCSKKSKSRPPTRNIRTIPAFSNDCISRVNRKLVNRRMMGFKRGESHSGQFRMGSTGIPILRLGRGQDLGVTKMLDGGFLRATPKYS